MAVFKFIAGSHNTNELGVFLPFKDESGISIHGFFWVFFQAQNPLPREGICLPYRCMLVPETQVPDMQPAAGPEWPRQVDEPWGYNEPRGQDFEERGHGDRWNAGHRRQQEHHWNAGDRRWQGQQHQDARVRPYEQHRNRRERAQFVPLRPEDFLFDVSADFLRRLVEQLGDGAMRGFARVVRRPGVSKVRQIEEVINALNKVLDSGRFPMFVNTHEADVEVLRNLAQQVRAEVRDVLAAGFVRMPAARAPPATLDPVSGPAAVFFTVQEEAPGAPGLVSQSAAAVVEKSEVTTLQSAPVVVKTARVAIKQVVRLGKPVDAMDAAVSAEEDKLLEMPEDQEVQGEVPPLPMEVGAPLDVRGREAVEQAARQLAGRLARAVTLRAEVLATDDGDCSAVQ